MSKKPVRDRLYAEPLDEIQAFSFDAKVASVFHDMIQRSVPGYGDIIPAIGLLAQRFVQSNERIYDLGCSLGAVPAAIRLALAENLPAQIIAVDNSAAMLEKAQKLNDKSSHITIDWQHADILEIEFLPSRLMVLNFTLQFVALEKRSLLLERIASALLPGGLLVLSEKIHFSDSAEQHLLIDLHHDYKRAHGYSDLEISQKRSSLENVLIPETLQTHQLRLQQAGFVSSYCWYQQYNFVSLLAFK
ncbi:MAG: carboxy-S-adenosyl-L-methionine synthase CmoA [Gammaproteobacteria bacterium]|nr:carboxy-S-adenosyl-L-methionine synthase CmoA [Gammaproteobacteria bacterium]